MWKNNPTGFGLLQPTKCYSSQDIGAPMLIFNFYHKHLQKYFAAKHVMSLPGNQAYDLIRKYLFIKHQRVGGGSSEEESGVIIISSQKDADDVDDNSDSGNDDNHNHISDVDDDHCDNNDSDDNHDDDDDENTYSIKIYADDAADDDMEFTVDVMGFADVLAVIYSNDSDISDSEDSDDISTHLSDVWLFLFGICSE